MKVSSVYLAAGQLEAIKEPGFAGMLSNTARMVELLNSRIYKEFTLTYHLFNDETHLSVIPSIFSKGLCKVYN